jgi:arylsulfatase A-like enzyme
VTTGLFVATPIIGEAFGFARGWSVMKPFAESTRAEEVYAALLQWLDRISRGAAGHKPPRFYAYVHVMGPHDPYRFDKRFTPRYLEARPYRGKLNKLAVDGLELEEILDGRRKVVPAEDRRYIRALYDSGVSAHDVAFGKLLEGLERRGLLRTTMLIHSSDHGEEMFERGKLGHTQRTLYEEVLRTPLLIHYPPLFPPGRVVQEQVELVDLVPTVLDALDLPPLRGTHGRSLLPVARGEERSITAGTTLAAVPSARAVRVGRFKLIQWRRGCKLYDLATDPGERHNLGFTAQMGLRACQIHLREGFAVPTKSNRLTGSAVEQPERETVTIDPKLRRQLEALGYINPGRRPGPRPAHPRPVATPPRPGPAPR